MRRGRPRPAQLLKENKPGLASLLRLYAVEPPKGKNWQSWAKPDVLQAVRDLLKQDKVGTEEQRPKLLAAAQVQLLLTMAP